MPKSQLQAMMAQELGTDWAKRFDHFEETPFAAASIGQVHRGVIGGLEVPQLLIAGRCQGPVPGS
jgi:predicted unusual protein kinase regulating ubiquinone biosynthesis (AarF/ABC1/UbiB family)